jgi:hypothetical protein
MSTEQETVFACVMDAIPKGEREQHGAVSAQLLGAVQKIQERANGYAFRLPTDSNTIVNVAEFMRNERLCCPFFTFTVEVEANAGPIWLHLTGRQGIKEFIIAEIGNYLNPAAAAAAGIG